MVVMAPAKGENGPEGQELVVLWFSMVAAQLYIVTWELWKAPGSQTHCNPWACSGVRGGKFPLWPEHVAMVRNH